MRDTTIIVSEFGSAVRKRGLRFVISRNGESDREVAANRVERILLPVRGASISTDAIALAIKCNVPVYFSQHNGKPVAYLTPAKGRGGANIRRAQYSVRHRTIVSLVKGFIRGKVYNQRELLKKKIRFRKDNEELNKVLHDSVIEQLTLTLSNIETIQCDETTLINKIMALEAFAASRYWASLETMIPARLRFPGRKTRGASDPVNMLLNYGYGILRNEVWSATTYAGLDPDCGFLHADRSSRPSLVLDLMEEFRAPVVDSSVMNLLNRRNIQPNLIAEMNRLTEWARIQMVQKINERLSSPVPYHGKSVRLQNVILRQAELIAHTLREQDTEYRPFLRRW